MKVGKLLLILLILSIVNANAQDKPIGFWRSHLPYNTAVSVATDGASLFVATQQSFYILDQLADEVTPYSKVDGMADVGMADIAYDYNTNTVVLAYTNSNIDLFKNNDFYNIPDLKLKTVTGSKTINDIYTEDGLAYLSTDIGIVVINLDRREVKETYTFTKNNQNIAIKSLTSDDVFLYAATDRGVYKANKNSPNLQAFSTWDVIDSTRNFVSIANQDGRIFATKADSLFSIENNALKYLYTAASNSVIRALSAGVKGVWVIENFDNFRGGAKKMTLSYEIIDSLKTTGYATTILGFVSADSAKFIADEFAGLKKRTLRGDPYNTKEPAGPQDNATFDIYAYNKQLLVAHGGYDDQYRPNNNGNGFSQFIDEEWTNYRIYQYPPFADSIINITNIIKGPDGTIYAGSTTSGLFILKPDGSYEYYKQNSFINPSSTGSDLYRVSGFAFDDDGNLWITVLGGTPNELVVRTKDGNWYQYGTNYSMSIPHSAAHLIIDNSGQKWYAAPGGGGVVVYDDNGTPNNKNDDRSHRLLSGEGSGGLPDNEVYCLANDKDGAIWIGTANGIGIVNCPRDVIDRTCEAEKRIVQFDDFAGFLFQNEQVKAIAVDGANRKWIGTNNGVWLIAADGNAIIERFTIDNSPLPSNIVQKITIDPVTGDVYIGTQLGLMSYRGTAIDGKINKSDDLITFPNPVPSGYTGTIAIRGLIDNADVRITDVSGQLVYRTKALGGQAVWNGLDYTGRRPQSGVYLIFATNKDGSETQTGKLVFME